LFFKSPLIKEKRGAMLKLIIVVVLWSSQVFAAPQFVSLKQSFQIFIQNAENTDIDTQVTLWKSNVESTLPDVYSELLKSSGMNPDQYRKKLASKWFPFIFQHSKEILLQFEAFEKESWPVVSRLAQRFPQTDFSDIRVVALPSLMMFDGMVIGVNGRLVALFGMDFFEMVKINPQVIPGANIVSNPPVVVAHEFTHILHAKISDFSNVGGIDILFEPLWREGLAQINSQILIPGTDLLNVLLDRNLASKCTSLNVALWAKEFIQDSQTTSENDLWEKYGKWFFTNQWQTLGVPRAGYCLGYHVVLSALTEYSLNDLIRMSRSKVYPLVKKHLEKIIYSSIN
jgi:hypothetical protein